MADYFRFHYGWLKQAERLSESERGRLLAGIAEYSVTGIVPEFRGNERYLFPLLSPAPDAPSEAEKPKKPPSKSAFEEFWTVYPRKVGKKAAEVAYHALMNRPAPPTIEQLIASVQAHKGTWNWKKENGQFIPHPTTYLTQDRWKDDLTNEPKNPPPKGKRGNWVEIEQNTLTDEQIAHILVDLDKDIE
jgi:hypothetical protein